MAAGAVLFAAAMWKGAGDAGPPEADDTDHYVSGANLVEFFAGWRPGRAAQPASRR